MLLCSTEKWLRCPEGVHVLGNTGVGSGIYIVMGQFLGPCYEIHSRWKCVDDIVHLLSSEKNVLIKRRIVVINQKITIRSLLLFSPKIMVDPFLLTDLILNNYPSITIQKINKTNYCY
jgi:hypothetical protein